MNDRAPGAARATDPSLATGHPQRAIVLLSKSAFAAAPIADMQRLAALAQTMGLAPIVKFAFSEQGGPSLLETLLTLRRPEIDEITIVPLILPMEPSFATWLRRSLARWQKRDPQTWPSLRIGKGLADSPMLPELLAQLLTEPASPPVAAAASPKLEASIVPPQKRRVLVCQGGACNAAGAYAIWGHLRNHQQRQDLRNTGDGTMTAMATCLGPCSLAPVLQVFPEGTYYGGVDEAAIDRIVTEHLIGGQIVDAYAYAPTGKKQSLRS